MTTPDTPLRHPLVCHPATPCPQPLALVVGVQPAAGPAGPGCWLHYQLQGDLAGLRLPGPATPGPEDGLWQHTCFEAFVAPAGDTGYHEFNFSPSGQWAAYRFRAERLRDSEAETGTPLPVPHMHWAPGADARSAVLAAWLPAAALPPGPALVLGLNAVIEDRDGGLSYWALRHPAARPDFHHPGGRVLTLPHPDTPGAHPCPRLPLTP